MDNLNDLPKVKHDPEKSIVVGPEFDFWLNEEDDIYDELYREKDSKTGGSVPS